MTDRVQPEQLVVADSAAWLDEHEGISDGVWLTLAKKGTVTPASLSYAQALEEALCSGWIDGRIRSLDAGTFLQHFTPRRKRSMWSQRNVGIVTDLIAAGRMRERGHAEIDRARADGRWERAYPGASSIEVPEDFPVALREAPQAEAAFSALSKSERYSGLFSFVTAASSDTRSARISRHISHLSSSDGDSPKP